MSTPSSPEPQKPPEDSGDHVHTCQCSEKQTIEPQKTDCHHHHNVINLSHIPSAPNPHIHPMSQNVHVHVHAPQNPVHTPKIPPPSCNCHLQEISETNQDIHEASIVQNRKLEADDRIEVSPLPPALPPRPPPRPRPDGQGTLSSRIRTREATNPNRGIRKYVFWCCACGGLSTILGALFLAVYFLLRSYTTTLSYFETIPTFIPATMLMLTGLCVMSLARRKNRYSYLIKVCGLCCLVCALTCVLVTITTTVIHMNRLQTLRECVYTQKTRTCTCFSVRIESQGVTDDGLRFIFDSTPDCEVIHGALYSCLRAMFGLSVSGILICIFSCMLVYQLLSHERKKMYWEQLELRCRSFYSQPGGPGSTHGSVRGPPMPPATYCSCCEECRYPPIAVGPQVYPWDAHHSSERFWTPGRVGNFYSPNPGEEIQQPQGENRERSGWSWRRLPWNRNSTQTEAQRDSSSTYQGVPSSADSQYGFSNQSGGDASIPVTGSSGSYSVLDNRPVGGVYIWGPPPPYSNPNSPARRPIHSPARYHHIHHHNHSHEAHCQLNDDRTDLRRRQASNKDNYENTADNEPPSNDTSESTDTSSCQDRVSHTLPVRKMKKRIDISSVKSVNQSPNCRANVKQVFTQNYPKDDSSKLEDEHGYHEPDLNKSSSNDASCRFLPRLQGVENAAFQKQENSPQKPETTESEVYFADVSSCCNISVQNDGQDSLLYDEALENQKPRLMSLQCSHKQGEIPKDTTQILQNFQENISSTVTEDEEYLAHRMGKRQMSTRSRLPFPLPNTNPEDLGSDMKADCNIPKDISQNSLCSSVQTPMTESTDDGLSPVTPSFPKNECCMNYFPEKVSEQTPTRQRHRTFSNTNLDEFLAPDAQYEIIQEQGQVSSFRHNYEPSNLTNTISGLNNYGQNYLQSGFTKPAYNQNNFNTSSPKNVPPKSLNLGQSPSRRNIGSNISSLIQNLGVNHVGLLYGEANSVDSEDLQTQGCHSDGTMDSGWQSGSEKQERKDNPQESTHKSVNV